MTKKYAPMTGPRGGRLPGAGGGAPGAGAGAGPYMVADIVATRGDPLADVSALSRVQFVMARGAVVRLPAQ